MNKIEISNPKISLIHFIDTSPNPPSTNMLENVDSGVNIHLLKIHHYNDPCNNLK